jgi:DNA-binding LytR/AlgR family response regulator
MPSLVHTYIHVGGYQHLSPEQIIRLAADRNYTYIYTANGRKILVSTTLKVLEERLIPYGFLRITRSDVINPAYVKKIWKDGAVQLADGMQIYPSRRRQGIMKKHALPVQVES